MSGRRFLKTSLQIFCFLMLVGVLVMMHFEGWSASTAVYFCIVSSVAIGYGDLPLSSDSSRCIKIVFVLHRFIASAH